MKTLILLLFFVLRLSAQSQQEYKLLSRHINQENGLTNLLVHHTMEDSRGIVWISTNGGLFLFDGKRARSVITNVGGNSFKAGRIYEGPNQFIWVNRYGYAVFSSQADFKDKFAIWCSTKERLIPTDSLLIATRAPFEKKEVASITGTPENHIVFLLNNGKVFSFDGRAYHMVFQTTPDYRLYTFYTAGKDFIFESMDSCYVMSPPFMKQKPLNTFPRSRFNPAPCSCTYKIQGNTAQVQFGSSPEYQKLVVPKTSSPPSGAAYAHGQFLWLVMPDEVAVYAQNPHVSDRYDQEIASAAVQLSESTYMGIRLDQEKQEAWIASAEGVYLLKLKPQLFEQISNFRSRISNLRGITSDENGQLYYNDFFTYQFDSSDTSTILSDTRGRIHLLHEKNTLWSGTYRPDILKINTTDGSTQVLKADPGDNRVSTTWIHRSEQSGLLYVGSTAGLFFKPAQKDTLIKKTTGTLIDRTEVRSIHENSKGLWLCTNEGLMLYEESRDTCLDFRHITNRTTVNHLHEATDGTFWLGTFGKGLYQWHPDHSTAKRYNYQAGFSDDRILAVYPDKNGFLWMPTYHGLIRFHPEREELYTFTKKDGLPNNEFNLYSHHRQADGTLLFGTLGGIVKFDPLKIPETISYAPVVKPAKIEILKADGVKEISPLTQSIITLSSSNDKLSIDFLLLDYESEELEQFDYRLIGQNNQWTPMRDASLDLSGFSKGQFTLEVRGRKGKSAYSTDIYRLDIKVPPPFYQNTVFIFWSVLSLIATLLLFFRWRTRRLRKDRILLQKEVKKRTQKVQQQAVELQKLNEVKTKLITNIAHELKTPLTMISGSLQLLLSQQHSNPESGLRTIDHNSKRLIRLIDQLIEVNKQEKALLKVQSQPVDLKKTLKDVYRNYEDLAETQGISFQLSLDERLSKQYSADALKLEYILHNLLSNAFKFTPKEGTIKLTASPNENAAGVDIAVADSGVGIPEKHQDRVFERFYQADASSGGMGIGLAIVKDYAEAMDGTVTLENKPGAGTTVTLYLPLPATSDAALWSPAPSLPDASSGKPAKGVSSSNAQKPLILIVEDHPEVQALFKVIFDQQFELATADNGKYALQLLEQNTSTPALIITDLMMPEVDGTTLIKRLKAHERFRLVPILVVSAKSDPMSKIEALNIGVDDYVHKPFHVEELKAIVNTLLSNAAARLNANTTAEPVDTPRQEKIKQHEKDWLNKVENVLWNRIDKGIEIKVKDLAQELHISERQLQRQLKLLTGLSPSGYINEIRLQRARQLINEGTYSTVAEIAYHLGYAYPSYFSKIFTTRFGQPPSYFFKP
ncbi:MAG: ATP-binding protein [Phaeodactylibacter sp.]|uniref:hybrid sensor histidine kinase/response regulator transcription factor n=1 Tax=Phaeodactylibacter sp. TaxID=1940289 RepID=UPI0032EF0277